MHDKQTIEQKVFSSLPQELQDFAAGDTPAPYVRPEPKYYRIRLDDRFWNPEARRLMDGAYEYTDFETAARAYMHLATVFNGDCGSCPYFQEYVHGEWRTVS